MQTLENEKLNYKILLVEDEKIVQMTMNLALTRMGCSVDLAENGKDAIEKADEHYDLILMDIGLPGMSGIDATIEIKHGKAKCTPIIALTGYPINEILIECNSAGMEAIYNKPLLGESLRKVLLKHSVKRSL